jgi:integrase
MLLTDFFENVYSPVRLRGKSENSKRLYRLCLVQFGRTLGYPPNVEDLTEANVLRHLSRRSDVAPATRNKELAELTALWRLAAQRKLIDTWPDVDSEHEPERAPIAWLPDELAALLSGAAKMEGVIGQVPASTWWTALIRVTLDTGERISAVRYARWNWIQGNWLLVPAENRKGKTRDRRYRLGDVTMESLEELKKHGYDGKNVFPWPYVDNYLWLKYKAVLAAAGLPSTRKHQLHCLRKTVGSAVYAAGLDPQDALDHSDRRTTQRYLDPRFTRTQQACDVLADFLAKPTRKPSPKRDSA